MNVPLKFQTDELKELVSTLTIFEQIVVEDPG